MKFFNKLKGTKTKMKQTVPSNVVSIGQNSKTRDNHIFLDAKTILARPKCQHYLFQLKEVIGVNDAYFYEFYQPVIENIAIRLQSAHASEKNHHAYDYGLIEHTLEATVFALRSSYQYNYFPDGDEEKIQRLNPIYTYITFLGAMFHDAGKTLTDMQFKIKINGDWKVWSWLYANIPTEKEEVEYRIERRKMNNKNAYVKTSHELIAPSMMVDVIPAKALKWIFEYSYDYAPAILIHLTHAIAGDLDNADAVGKNIALGDKTSTEKGLSGASITQIETSSSEFGDLTSLPLHEAFLKVLRTIMHSPENYKLHINQRHTQKLSHVERYGNMYFFASQFAVSIVSKYMAENGVSIPSDNKLIQILADNNVTFKAPSGDTLWWLDFTKSLGHGTRDLSYIAISEESLAKPDIEDLSVNGVHLRFAPKTNNSSQHGVMLPQSEEDQVAYDLIYANNPDIVNGNSKVTANEPKLVKIDDSDDSDPIVGDSLPGNIAAHEPKPIQNLMSAFATPKERPKGSGKGQSKQKGNRKTPAQKKPRQKPEAASKPAPKREKPNKPVAKPASENTDSALDELFPDPVSMGSKDAKPSVTETPNTDSNSQGEPKTPAPTGIEKEKVHIDATNQGSNDTQSPTKKKKTLFQTRQENEGHNMRTGTHRKHVSEASDKAFKENIVPYIQQQIDLGKFSFNKKDSPIHYTSSGLLIVAPQFFELFEESTGKKYKDIVKTTSFCHYWDDISTSTFRAKTNDKEKIAANTNRVSGYLLNFHGLKYKGKPLPPNPWLELIHPMMLTENDE
ncbi:TraI domain-containing protein [Vibrio mediterranei]|uniref:TraI domain-containing protein n=1 Tax=Vibrio mediterranei TaxID=689 RepID=UPI0040677323